jgi:hypothetical protein
VHQHPIPFLMGAEHCICLMPYLQHRPQLSRDHVNSDVTKWPPNLTRPYDEWLGISTVPSEKYVKEAESVFQRVLLQEKPIRLPGVDYASQPRKPVPRDLSLGKETTRAVIHACMRKGSTVISA